MEEKQIKDDLASIRSLMERSSKFISLSGLSGILAGVYALIGAAVAYRYHYADIQNLKLLVPSETLKRYNDDTISSGIYLKIIIPPLLITALIVLLSSISTGIFLSIRKAKRKGQAIWGKSSQLLLFSMLIPLITGGLLTSIFINRGYYDIIACSTLVFYGLALINASNFTFTDVRYLGLCEIILGLIAACLPGYGLLFWAIGFGVLHIVYGSLMYFKYDR